MAKNDVQNTESRAKKQTREDLIQVTAKLEQVIQLQNEADYNVRETLSKLLNSFEYVSTNMSFARGHNEERKTLVLDWYGIAFKIGELKGDADGNIKSRKIGELTSEMIQLKEHADRMSEELRYRNDPRDGRRM